METSSKHDYRRWSVSAFLIFLTAIIVSAPHAVEAQQGMTAGYDLTNTHDAGVSKITLGNIQNLEHQWTYITQLDSEGGDADFAGVEVMPLLKGNTLYFPDTFGSLHAVNRRTGIWKEPGSIHAIFS